MKAAIYARVSTLDKGQDTEVQLRDLRSYAQARGWVIAGEYVDKGQSGAKDRRPALDRLLADVRKRKVDLVLCWRLDRLGRSLKHLILTLDELQSIGVGFVSYNENLDLTPSTGRLMFQLLGAFAEFERNLIIAPATPSAYYIAFRLPEEWEAILGVLRSQIVDQVNVRDGC